MPKCAVPAPSYFIAWGFDPNHGHAIDGFSVSGSYVLTRRFRDLLEFGAGKIAFTRHGFLGPDAAVP